METREETDRVLMERRDREIPVKRKGTAVTETDLESKGSNPSFRGNRFQRVPMEKTMFCCLNKLRLKHAVHQSFRTSRDMGLAMPMLHLTLLITD